MSEHTLAIIDQIDRLIKLELKPSIHLRDEKACLIRIEANLAELKFLSTETQLENFWCNQ